MTDPLWPDVPAPGSGRPGFDDADDGTDPMPDEPVTELGHANRLVRVYGDRLRHVAGWPRGWLIWDGRRWVPDVTGQVHRWAKAIARRLTADAMSLMDDPGRRAALNLARKCEASAGVRGALTLAATHEEVVVRPEDLDADPFLLNTANGTLDLRTGELRPHDRLDLLTKLTGAAYRPEAVGLVWTRFLVRVQPQAEMRAFLARLLGHALEGRVIEHLLPIFYGDGGNGKSTFVTAIKTALGDYCAPADRELLVARDFAAHPTGVADLHGLRVAILTESDAGQRLAEGTVKQLTSSEPVKARRMREDFWSFRPSHTFLMLTNHRPIIGGQDHGIWRRVRLVPWQEQITEEERDPELDDRLALEVDAVLAWMVAGHRDWRENGLHEPVNVIEATADYREDSDALGRFLADRCIRIAGVAVASARLFREWERWCTAEGIRDPGTQRAFSQALQKRGHRIEHTRTGKFWRGIGLKTDDEESPGSDP